MGDMPDSPLHWPEYRVETGESASADSLLELELDYDDEQVESLIIRLDGNLKLALLAVPTKTGQFVLLNEETHEYIALSDQLDGIQKAAMLYQHGFMSGYMLKEYEGKEGAAS